MLTYAAFRNASGTSATDNVERATDNRVVAGSNPAEAVSLSVYVRKLNVVIFFAIILQNTFKIS